MHIRNELLSDGSKEKATEIAQYIMNDPSQMQFLMDCFFDDNWRLCQRTSWTLRHLAHHRPSILMPYIRKMIPFLDHKKHDAIIRNTVCILQYIDIPDDIAGEVYERCFEYMVDHDRPTAIRAFSMTVLYNISNHYPELKAELCSEISLHGNYGTTGFKNRAKHTLSALRKELDRL